IKALGKPMRLLDPAAAIIAHMLVAFIFYLYHLRSDRKRNFSRRLGINSDACWAYYAFLSKRAYALGRESLFGHERLALRANQRNIQKLMRQNQLNDA